MKAVWLGKIKKSITPPNLVVMTFEKKIKNAIDQAYWPKFLHSGSIRLFWN
jgi:hypothetical protein